MAADRLDMPSSFVVSLTLVQTSTRGEQATLSTTQIQGSQSCSVTLPWALTTRTSTLVEAPCKFARTLPKVEQPQTSSTLESMLNHCGDTRIRLVDQIMDATTSNACQLDRTHRHGLGTALLHGYLTH